MNFNFLPRFYYLFPFSRYLKTVFTFADPVDLPDWFPAGSIFFHNHARTGLRLLLNSILKENLTVGVQAFTCQTVFQSIKRAGHKIKFLDINENLRLDLEDLRNKIDEIDVLLITHTFGYPEDFESIRKLAGKKIIIEDCAHSFLSKSGEEYTGTMGDAAFFSTGPAKLPPIGQGGFVLINKPSMFPGFQSKYSKLPVESKFSELKHILKLLLYSLLLQPPLYGFVSYPLGKLLDRRIDFMKKHNFAESRGFRFDRRFFFQNWQLIEKLVRTNRKNYLKLNLESSDNIRIINKSGNTFPNYFALPLLVNQREKLLSKLNEEGFEGGKHFANSIEWARNYGYVTGDCPKTEEIINKVLTVPAHSGIKPKHLLKLSKLINESREYQ